MPAIAPDIPESTVFTALRSALVAVFACEVVKGLSNDVAQPLNDYIAMTPLSQERLGTNASLYPVADGAQVTRQERYGADYTVQLDFYGITSGDRVSAFANLFRSDYLFQYGFSPLYTSDPRQLMFKDASQKMTERWSIDAHLFYMSKISGLPQQSANLLTSPSFTSVP